jgi:hypothetical protein
MSFIKKYWLGISALLAIGIFGYILYSSFVGYYTYPSEGIADTIGKSIGYASMVFIFTAHSLRTRGKRLEFWILCFTISFSICATYDSIKTNKQVCQLNNFKQELARLAEDISYTTSTTKSKNEYSVEEYGDFSKLLPIIKNLLESEYMTSEINEINEAIANLGVMLTPANFCEQEKIFEAKNLLSIFADKLNLYKRRYAEEVKLKESEIKEAFSGNENLKKEALKGFEKGKNTSNKFMNEYFNLERQCVEQVNNILNFVSAKFGTFWNSDGTLIFEKDEDRVKFDQLVQGLLELGQKEDVLFEKLEMHRQSVLKKMQNYDKD